MSRRSHTRQANFGVAKSSRSARSDIVLLRVPLTEETHDILKGFSAMSGLSTAEVACLMLEPQPEEKFCSITRARYAALRQRQLELAGDERKSKTD